MAKGKPSADTEEFVRKEGIDASFSSFSELTEEHQERDASISCRVEKQDAEIHGHCRVEKQDAEIHGRLQDLFASGNTDSSDNESNSSKSSQTLKSNLIMAHLLRLACASKADDLPIITSQLFDLGVVGDIVRQLTQEPSSVFDAKFKSMFAQEVNSPTSPNFWKVSRSRFLNDFEEIRLLGHGGFGHVVLCKNKVDKKLYAMKKIPLEDTSLHDDSILREVATLSRLQHKHVVRYYQAWFGTENSVSRGDAACSADSFSFCDGSSNGRTENNIDSSFLYIQMEYCQSTLRKMFQSNYHPVEEVAWKIFHQILEGLAHIHDHGIVHRDLNPNNIFFDAKDAIKIGDFGLAKFLKSGELDGTGTGQVGTELYRAPEIEQDGRPKLNQKADMYSLGVIFLELWHPFETEMERRKALTELKKNGTLPSDLANQFPEQAKLVKKLTSPSPSNRPSPTELLSLLDCRSTRGHRSCFCCGASTSAEQTGRNNQK